MRARMFLITTFALSSLACGPKPVPTTAPSEPAATAGEPADPELVSVRPGINDRYFEEGAVEEWGEVLERERREVIEHRDAIVAALELEPGLAVADIGAGTGAFIAGLSAAVGESGKVYAVDIVPAFLDHLRARAQAEGLANLEVVEGTTTATNLADASVDLLFMSDVYHHIEYPEVYLDSLFAALRPGGRLVIVEFARVPGKTSERMMKHVRQDQATLTAEVTGAGFTLEREIETIPFEENYMLVFRRPDLG